MELSQRWQKRCKLKSSSSIRAFERLWAPWWPWTTYVCLVFQENLLYPSGVLIQPPVWASTEPVQNPKHTLMPKRITHFQGSDELDSKPHRGPLLRQLDMVSLPKLPFIPNNLHCQHGHIDVPTLLPTESELRGEPNRELDERILGRMRAFALEEHKLGDEVGEALGGVDRRELPAFIWAILKAREVFLRETKSQSPVDLLIETSKIFARTFKT